MYQYLQAFLYKNSQRLFINIILYYIDIQQKVCYYSIVGAYRRIKTTKYFLKKRGKKKNDNR